VLWYEHGTSRSAPWKGGAPLTSDSFIRKTYSQRRRVNVSVTVNPPPIETGAAREARFFWSRPPTEQERNYRYCHALDLNLAYAAVASSLSLPVGHPTHHNWPKFDKRMPGVWLIEPGPGLLDPANLIPAPWQDDHRRDKGGTYWVTSPTMERCAELGIEPIEAYTWGEHHAYLRPWYEMIRDARAELLDVGGAPLEAVKEISRRGVGRLASRGTQHTWRGQHLDTDPLYQPYWAWAVIAECRARLHRRLSALDVRPVAIDTDAVYFLSSRSSPGALAVALGLPLGDGLGQFKAAGSCSGKDARAALELPAAVNALRALVKP
jgi:hypothetical protein